jgi:hypothetical protein
MVIKTVREDTMGVVDAIRWKLVWFGQYVGWILGARNELPSPYYFEPLEWKWDVAAEFTRIEKTIASQHPRPTPVTPISLIVLAVAGMSVGNRRGAWSLIALPILAAASLIPVVVGYPSVWGSFDGAVGVLAVLAGIIILSGAGVRFLGSKLIT